jgi:hypothetical protein
VQQDNIDLCEICLPPPYEDIEGQWVQRKDCTKQKSFGYYECKICHGIWKSAHAQKNYRQACKPCNSYYFPFYMWENENLPGQRNKIIDDDKPHMKDLCEACKKGKCIIGNKKK